MAAFLSEVSVILQIINQLNDLHQTAQGNVERCRLLNVRCQGFKAPLEQLQQRMVTDTRGEDANAAPLTALRKTLSDCVDFMTKFCQSGFKRSCLNFVNAKNIEKEFKSLNTLLLQSSTDLHITLTIKHEITRDELAAAHRADEEHIFETIMDCMAVFHANTDQQLSKFAQSNAGLEAKLEELKRQLGEQTLRSDFENATVVMDAVHEGALRLPERINQASTYSKTNSVSPPPVSPTSPAAAKKILAYATLHLESLLGTGENASEQFDPNTAPKLGQGSFGTVFSGHYEGEAVAIKFFGSTIGLSDREVFIIHREAAPNPNPYPNPNPNPNPNPPLHTRYTISKMLCC